jgi:hypothetical protein
MTQWLTYYVRGSPFNTWSAQTGLKPPLSLGHTGKNGNVHEVTVIGPERARKLESKKHAFTRSTYKYHTHGVDKYVGRPST